jgi:MFS family permease
VIGSPLLRTADGRRFLAAQLMDSLSAGISLVALPWLVLDAGGTQSQAGAAFLAGTLPYVALGLHAGHVGDHRPRKRVMVAGTAVQTAAALVIPLVLTGVAVEDVPIALIYAAALVVTAGRVFVDAAAFGAIAKLVGGGHFVQGQAALSFVWSLGFLVGPAVGGGLIGLVGIAGALWVQAVGFAVAVALMASIRFDLGPDLHPGADDGGGEGVLAGLRLVLRDPVLRSLTAVGMAWNLTTNVIYSLIVVFARHDLSADAGQAGIMLSIAGAAGLAGGLLAPLARHRLGPTRALRSSIALSGVGALGTALAQEIISATIAYAVLEFSALLFITLLISERQTRAAPSEQGRVGITGRMAALTAASCGALLGALLVAVISLPAILLLAALLTIVVAGVGQRAISV